MSPAVSVAADLLVAILLVATIATSVRLSRRMAQFRADEHSMRQTIVDLVAATDTAERAIAGLRATVQDCDRSLGDRLAAATAHSSRLAAQVSAGESVISRVTQMAETSRRIGDVDAPRRLADDAAAEPPAATRDGLRATIQAAREVAERAARRREVRAA